MKPMKIATMLAVFALLVTPAWADWDPGDGHKMHFPQLPDPFGWDVDITRGFVADDWLCTGSGPVSDIHFWISWQGGNVGTVDGVWVKIWDADPGPDGSPVFDRIFWDGFTVRPYGSGNQGWYTPAPWGPGNPPQPIIIPNDHTEYFQVNIDPILDPFIQDAGSVYWLELHIIPEESNVYAGWKTSQDHWGSDAMGEDMQNYFELFDPINMTESLDMAFVITPEPGSLALLGMGILGTLVVFLRRRFG